MFFLHLNCNSLECSFEFNSYKNNLATLERVSDELIPRTAANTFIIQLNLRPRPSHANSLHHCTKSIDSTILWALLLLRNVGAALFSPFVLADLLLEIYSGAFYGIARSGTALPTSANKRIHKFSQQGSSAAESPSLNGSWDLAMLSTDLNGLSARNCVNFSPIALAIQ